VSDLGHLPTAYQIAHALDGRALGRRTIVQRTGVSESTVRTHLNKLRDAGYAKMEKAGTSLTATGWEVFGPVVERVSLVPEIALDGLSLGGHQAAALVDSAEADLPTTLRLRDSAVREGAPGALLLVKRGQTWALNDDDRPLADRDAQDAAHIDEATRGRTGTGLIVTFGATPRVAQRALWRVIVELIPPAQAPSHSIRS
jgi:DNA-binding transcriptional ArsR family regulator